MSTTSLPLEMPLATPSWPNSTASTCGVSGTMMMTASASSATSLADLQATPPAAISSGATGATSCRRTLWPAARRWPAIGRPMVPSPMKPMSIISVVSSSLEGLRGMPGQAFQRRGARLVFAADPAAIADRVEMAEQEGIVDLAGAGLVAAGIVRELDVGDAVEMLLH